MYTLISWQACLKMQRVIGSERRSRFGSHELVVPAFVEHSHDHEFPGYGGPVVEGFPVPEQLIEVSFRLL